MAVLSVDRKRKPMRHRRTTLAVLTAAALSTATLTGAAPAEMPPGQHCAIGTGPMVAGASQPVDVTCFDTDDEMWEFLTGQPLDQPAITRDAIDEYNTELSVTGPGADLSLSSPLVQVEARLSLAAAASVVLGVEYDGTGYSGTSLALYGSSGAGCSTGSTYGFPNLGSYGWNDRTSSATSSGGCRGQHYQNTNYTGSIASVTCSPNCSSMGALNNATSSIVYRR